MAISDDIYHYICMYIPKKKNYFRHLVRQKQSFILFALKEEIKNTELQIIEILGVQNLERNLLVLIKRDALSLFSFCH